MPSFVLVLAMRMPQAAFQASVGGTGQSIFWVPLLKKIVDVGLAKGMVRMSVVISCLMKFCKLSVSLEHFRQTPFARIRI